MANSNRFWDRQAKRFNDYESEEMTELLERSSKYFDLKDTVLDFGCGTGVSSIAISEHVSTVTGIDLSTEMIRYAVLNAQKKAADNVKFMAGSIKNGTAKSESVDVVVAFNVFHLLDDLEETLNVIFKTLKPGGIMISNTACMGEKSTMAVGLINFISRFGLLPHLTGYSCKELTDKVVEAGFEVVEMEVLENEAPNLYLVVKKW